jgi:hypothetical protein
MAIILKANKVNFLLYLLFCFVFSWNPAIQERVTAVLRSIPKEAFANSFQKFYERCQ